MTSERELSCDDAEVLVAWQWVTGALVDLCLEEGRHWWNRQEIWLVLPLQKELRLVLPMVGLNEPCHLDFQK